MSSLQHDETSFASSVNGGASKNSGSGSHSQDETTTRPDAAKLATIQQVFSFANSRQTRAFIAGGFAFAVVSGAVFPAVAFSYSRAFQNLSASASTDSFLSSVRSISFAFLTLGGIIFVSTMFQTMFMETAALNMTNELKRKWFQALLRQDMAYYDLKDIASRATILSTNALKFRTGLGHKLTETLQYLITFLGALGFAFYSCWQCSLAILAISPLIVLSAWFLIKLVTTQSTRSNASYEEAGSIVSTAVASIRTVLALNAVEKMVSLYEQATGEACRSTIQSSWLLGLANGCMWVSYSVAYILITLFGSFLLYRNVRNSGCDPSATVDGVEPCDPSGADIFGALMGVTIAAAVIPQISLALGALTDTRAACYPAITAMNRQKVDVVEQDEGEESHMSNQDVEKGTVVQQLAECSELPKYEIDSSSMFGLQPTCPFGQVEFKNVSFAFPARPETMVLNEFSLMIPAGKTVALVGPSGSGKSSAVQLIERFYDPTSGSVTFDGVDLRRLNVRWLREQIGLVLQEPKLFSLSIEENIALGSPTHVTHDEVVEAARMANAHDFIITFPQGYNTQLGELGSRISVGQKQRIAIARAIIRKPKIFVFDEATSSLDLDSEAVVQHAIDRLMKLGGVTTLVIAHRLSTIKNADVIAVVENGQIVEIGTHEELLEKRNRYFDLVEAQQKPMTKARVENTSNVEGVEQPEEREAQLPSDSVVDSSCLEDDSESGPAEIRFRNVHFCYPARPEVEVFRGLNLTVRPGETLAIVGPSGCGKSTVMHLIEQFYRPTSGCIEYHGVDIREININWLRNEFGLVSQEAVLFPTSIEENIRLGFPQATKEDVEVAARKANCHDFIMSFPEGYQTNLGSADSCRLSGGERQRIALARAIIKTPNVLLLDEATSSLDTLSEKVVQAALDDITADKKQTCIVIAHRLSTIRNVDRIAVINEGKVEEMGTHDELMALTNGRYRHLQELQNVVGAAADATTGDDTVGAVHVENKFQGEAFYYHDELLDVSGEETKVHKRRAWILGYDDRYYIAIGAVGALIAGLYFPAFGFVFAFMIELLYQSVLPCPPLYSFASCQEYYMSVADGMQNRSLQIFYAFLGLGVVTLIGDMILFWGFGAAAERMNKRVRDSAFTNLLRQEVGWFDVRSPSMITAQLAVDAALLHAFVGEPVRTMALSIASVIVGIIVSFVFMWPFALLTMLTIPFLSFGSKMKMKRFMGGNIPDDTQGEQSPGAIAIETLSNMRTIASMTLESKRAAEYARALKLANPNPVIENLAEGATLGFGQACLMWVFALLIWWGGFLLLHYSFSFRSYLISWFALMFSMHGLALARQGAVDGDKAKEAAARIFSLIDRKSEIDPLSDEGKKDI